MRLQGKRVLITGAGSGIGRATALLMADEGAEIAFTFCHNETGAIQLTQEIEQKGRKSLCIQADMNKDEEINQLADRVEREFGEIDILVNNAGGLVERLTFFEITRECWDEIMAVNLWSVVLLSQRIGIKMKERGRGVIVNNASVAGRFGGGVGALSYGAAKGALITLTQAMARELIEYGIRVNAIAPGIIDTPFHEKFTTPDAMKKMMSRVPIGRPGTAEEMASIILFLSSDESRYLVGATIDANGGMWVI